MEGLFRNVTALEVGEYDFTGPKGEKYPFIVVYNDATKKNLTFTLDKDCVPPAIEFGTKVDIWVTVQDGDKIVRGEDRDRSIGTLKLRAVSIELAKAGAVNERNGKAPLAAAAA